jgi:hypothetical protein
MVQYLWLGRHIQLPKEIVANTTAFHRIGEQHIAIRVIEIENRHATPLAVLEPLVAEGDAPHRLILHIEIAIYSPAPHY